MLTPSSSPAQPIGGPVSPRVHALAFYKSPPAISTATASPTSPHPTASLLGLGDGTFQPTRWPRSSASRISLTPSSSPAISTAMGSSTSPMPTSSRSMWCSATATARSSRRSPTRPATPSPSLVAGDFNGDGKLDLAVAEPYDEPDDPNGILVFLGNGDGTLRPPTRYAVGNNPNYLVAGDFNNDGRTDLAFGHPTTRRSGLANLADGGPGRRDHDARERDPGGVRSRRSPGGGPTSTAMATST